MVGGPHYYGPKVRQSIMVEVNGTGKLLSSWQRGSKERKGPGTDMGKGIYQHPTSFSYTPPASSFHYHPGIHSNY